MKKIILFLCVGALAAGLCSCSKESGPGSGPDALGTLTVSFDFQDALTKATVAATATENTVNRLCLWVFDENGMLANPVRVLTAAEIAAKSATISKVRTGTKTVYAVVNHGGTYQTALEGATTKAAFEATQFSLDVNGRSSLVAVGSGSATVTASGGSVSITLTRRMARVCLKSVKNSLPAPYGAMTLRHAFLCDVQTKSGTGSAAPSSETFVNKSGTIDDGANHIIGAGSYAISNAAIKSLTFQALGESVANAATKSFADPGILFYAGRNTRTAKNNGYNLSTPTATTLMVVATVGGTDYYYPVPLTTGLEAGHTYDVTLDIVGLGNTADKAYDQIQKGTMSVTIGVADWTVGGTVNEQI